jgi:hypothetical protein
VWHLIVWVGQCASAKLCEFEAIWEEAMTEQIADEVPTKMSHTMSDMVDRIRHAAEDVDLDRIRDTAASAKDGASAALSSVDLETSRKALKKRAKQARKTAKTASKTAKAAREAATAAGKAAAAQAKKSKKSMTGKPTLRDRVFGWPLYSVAAAGALLGSLAWWRGRQRQALPAAVAPPVAPPSEVNVVDAADVDAAERRSTG